MEINLISDLSAKKRKKGEKGKKGKSQVCFFFKKKKLWYSHDKLTGPFGFTCLLILIDFYVLKYRICHITFSAVCNSCKKNLAPPWNILIADSHTLLSHEQDTVLLQTQSQCFCLFLERTAQLNIIFGLRWG